MKQILPVIVYIVGVVMIITDLTIIVHGVLHEVLKEVYKCGT